MCAVRVCVNLCVCICVCMVSGKSERVPPGLFLDIKNIDAQFNFQIVSNKIHKLPPVSVDL